MVCGQDHVEYVDCQIYFNTNQNMRSKQFSIAKETQQNTAPCTVYRMNDVAYMSNFLMSLNCLLDRSTVLTTNPNAVSWFEMALLTGPI